MIKKQPNTLYAETKQLKLGVTGKKPSAGRKTATDHDGTERLFMLSEARETGGSDASTGAMNLAAAANASNEKKPARPKALSIGIWDIDVHAGYLYRVLDEVNTSQSRFEFHPVEASVPFGLTASGERTRKIAEAAGFKPSKKELETNALASDIYTAARPVRDALGLDLLIVLIRPMIMELKPAAGETEAWNLFSTSKKRVVICSALEMRRYASEAQRSIEACLAMLIVSAVITELYRKVELHDDTRGCVFDYCEMRDDIVESLKKMNVCKESLKQIPSAVRNDVILMFDAIRSYGV
jgi:hypothetical protein